MASNFEMRMNDRREELFDRIHDVVGQVISFSSKTRAVEESSRLGTKYIERMRAKKEELDEIDEQIQELEQVKKQIRENWETDAVRFEDL
jgi:hypothetical protein